MDKCVILGFFVLFAGGRVCFGALISGAVTLREPAAGTAEQRGVSWCKKCYFGVFVEKVFSRDPGWGGYRKKRTGGGSGYDHPSPSIPLPDEGRGKPVATQPGILGALAASVTDLQTVACIMCFLRVFGKAAGRWRLGWLADLDVSSGVHGVTRPTSHGLAAMRWVIVGCGFKA